MQPDKVHPTNNNKNEAEKVNPMIYIVFISLLLDLLAFTMILPLLPSLLEHYKQFDSDGLYGWLSQKIKYFQELVNAPEQYNLVLFGGFLGSMFSFLQFIISPIAGGVSDVIGRKPVMIICLVGIASSYAFWAFSSNLLLFIMARFVGGISKGNVSLSMAIIADVSSMRTRTTGMALVGVAFSLGFIIGPMIGASFAVWAKNRTGSWFVIPATFAFSLAFLNLLFFGIFFKETLPPQKRRKDLKGTLQETVALMNLKKLFRFEGVTDSQADIVKLRKLGLIYFVYLFIYSGLEFTLTFLTHHVFKYTSMQQGWMFFSIGLIMASLQGGYVRKLPLHKIKSTAVYGLWLIVPSFVCVGLATRLWLLYLGLFLFAVSTALVVPCMMTLASGYGSPQQKGTVMGIFRSLGALARASGPILASVFFWSLGSSTTYLFGAVVLVWPALALKRAL